MSTKYCPICGNAAQENDTICKACGNAFAPQQSQYQQPMYQQPPYQQPPYQQPPYPQQQPYNQAPQYYPYQAYQKVKIPGRGFGITSMIMGILSLVYSTPLMSLLSIPEFENFRFDDIVANSAFCVLAFYVSIFVILGLIFGFNALSRGYKNNVSKSGLIMSGIAIAIVIMVSIILSTR